MPETRRAIAGARAKLYADGEPVGWCTRVQIQQTTNLMRVDVLGDIHSKEIEPVGVTVSITADFVRILKTALVQMGVWVEGSTPDIINFPPLLMEVFDEVGGEPIARVHGVRPENKTLNVDRNGVATANATFQAVKVVTDGL